MFRRTAREIRKRHYWSSLLVGCRNLKRKTTTDAARRRCPRQLQASSIQTVVARSKSPVHSHTGYIMPSCASVLFKNYCCLLSGFVVDSGLEMKKNSNFEEQRRGKSLDRVTLSILLWLIYLVLKILHLSPYKLFILQIYTNTPPQDGAKTSYRPILLQNAENIFSDNHLVNTSAT